MIIHAHYLKVIMDKASAYRVGDCRLESCGGHSHNEESKTSSLPTEL
jgi:hypothetical protein